MQRQLRLSLALTLLAVAALLATGGARAEEPIVVDYGVSGLVAEAGGAPVEGVAISGTPYTLVTDAAGEFALFATLGTTYTLTPSKAGYRFEPPALSVTVVAGILEVEFVAIRVETFLPLVTGDARAD
jgi:hypothetical protein